MEPVLSKGYYPTHVTESTNVVAAKSVLHTIVVNGLTTEGDISVYDGTDATGTLIAVLHLDATTSVSVQPITFIYDCKMDTGIHLEYDQAVVADLTVTWI
jgi:hypothetical protein